TAFDEVLCPGPGPLVFEGNCSAFFGSVTSLGGISQVLSTTPGVPYGITFALRPDGGSPSAVSVSFGGASLLTLANPPASAFHAYQFAITPTAAAQTLAFSFRDDPGFINLDGVSVSSLSCADVVGGEAVTLEADGPTMRAA